MGATKVIIDTSIIVSILRQEDDWLAFQIKLAESPKTIMSAASLLETGIVVAKGELEDFKAQLGIFLSDNDVSVEPFTRSQAELAIRAYGEFGKGSGHPARLNFGDCMTYALAKETGEPLLFKGNDFSQTDLTPA
jgi:ribonuclease VapC